MSTRGDDRTIDREPLDIEARLRWQAGWCGRLGSPLYEALLNHAADDYASGGPVSDVLAGREADPVGWGLGLRLMGATHRLALAGEAPELASCYPSTGGRTDVEGAWRAQRTLAAERRDHIAALLDRPIQTNEVGRSAALVGGFLTAGARWGLPLRLLELGSSAGLNLRWDHYLYEARGTSWGDPASPVRLCDFDTPPAPPFDVSAEVIERRGCDGAPVDPSTEDGRLTLMSFVWPDQVHRIRLLRAALDLAQRVPAPVDEADAVEWAPTQLETPRPVTTTVVFHSVFWQYLSHDQQERLTDVIQSAGRRAGATTPLAWLSMEPGKSSFEVRLRMWPGEEDRVIAHAGPHGGPVRWAG
jgi:hypothetical protein